MRKRTITIILSALGVLAAATLALGYADTWSVPDQEALSHEGRVLHGQPMHFWNGFHGESLDMGANEYGNRQHQGFLLAQLDASSMK